MKATQEKITYPVQHSFKVLKYSVSSFDMPFHYHTDYELVHIMSGSGKRYIGNNVHKFKAGDMVFLGPGLPHFWMSDNVSGNEKQNTEMKCIVLQFSGSLFSGLIDTPEFIKIKKMFGLSVSGLKISNIVRDEINLILEEMINLSGVERFTGLMKILDLLSSDNSVKQINSGPVEMVNLYNDQRIDNICNFIKSCFSKKITIKDAAELANMESSAFCRYFKDKTLKTFMQLLTETRVNQACILLNENQLNINQIAYHCGFNNISNFYRQFKKIMGCTPTEYQKS